MLRPYIRDNSRHFGAFRLFEIGVEIHKQPEGLPDEIPHLAAAMFSRDDGSASLFELKRVAECLMPGAEVRPAEARPYEHPARCAGIYWRGVKTARLFELHPSLVEGGRGAVLDIDLREMERVRHVETRYRPIRRFPASEFDLSVVAAAREPAGGIERRLKQFAGPSLVAIEFVRQYAGPPLPEDTKSVSFRLTVAAEDRTLSSEDVAAIRARVIDGMKALGYDLRL